MKYNHCIIHSNKKCSVFTGFSTHPTEPRTKECVTLANDISTIVLSIQTYRNVESSIVDCIDFVVWMCTVDGAANRLSSSKNLLYCSGQLTSHRSITHCAGNVNHLVHGDVSIVLDCKTINMKELPEAVLRTITQSPNVHTTTWGELKQTTHKSIITRKMLYMYKTLYNACMNVCVVLFTQ